MSTYAFAHTVFCLFMLTAGILYGYGIQEPWPDAVSWSVVAVTVQGMCFAAGALYPILKNANVTTPALSTIGTVICGLLPFAVGMALSVFSVELGVVTVVFGLALTAAFVAAMFGCYFAGRTLCRMGGK